jgi:hypothetical protein
MYSKKRKCNFGDSFKIKFPLIELLNLQDMTIVKCTVCSLIFSLASGGKISMTDDIQAKNALVAKSQSRGIFVDWSLQKPSKVWLLMKVTYSHCCKQRTQELWTALDTVDW